MNPKKVKENLKKLRVKFYSQNSYVRLIIVANLSNMRGLKMIFLMFLFLRGFESTRQNGRQSETETIFKKNTIYSILYG